MGAGVVGLIGSVADDALSQQGGLAGLLSGADLNQMAEQLDMSDPSNLAYVAWCKEFATDKVDGTSSIWNAPGDVHTFRSAVTSLPGYGVSWYWKDVIGKIDQNYQLKVNTTTDQPGGRGKQKDLTGGTVFIWPWEPGALKAAAWWMWLVWLLIPTTAILLIWGIWRMVRRKPRKSRRPKRRRRRKAKAMRKAAF